MSKGKEICGKCKFWIRDYKWDDTLHKKDKRKMGICHFKPPKLCQNLIPFIVREKGLNNLKNKLEMFQIRPVTENTDFCGYFVKR